MTRLRDLGDLPSRLPPGPLNAITDVEGVRVGHVTLVEGEGPLIPGKGPIRTGVTAILPHNGNLFKDKVAAAVYTLNGFGKCIGFEQVRELGTLETPVVLTNTLNVGLVADAVITYMLRENPEIGIKTSNINPIVGETNDGFLNDIQGRHVQSSHVWQAIETAVAGPVAEGNVGAGTGTSCFQFKGGIGSASRCTPNGQFTVGALVQTNFGVREDLMIMGLLLGQRLKDTYRPKTGPGSIMMILATDAPLDTRQLQRLALRAGFGLARTGSVCHHGSGDFVVAFSTTRRYPHYTRQIITETPVLYAENDHVMNGLFLATVESVEEAILNALVAAETMTGRDNHVLHGLPAEARESISDHLRSLADQYQS